MKYKLDDVIKITDSGYHQGSLYKIYWLSPDETYYGIDPIKLNGNTLLSAEVPASWLDKNSEALNQDTWKVLYGSKVQ